MDEYISLSGSSSSSSRSSRVYEIDYEPNEPIVCRVESFNNNTYSHIEDPNPYVIAEHVGDFMWGKQIDEVKITVNGIVVPLYSINLTGINNATGNTILHADIIEIKKLFI